MKNFALAGLVAGAFSAAVIGFAGPAHAGVDLQGITALSNGSGVYDIYDNDSNYPWINQLVPRVYVPHVDTSVRN
ncbi:hypothetical protein [Mycolicibacterium frederiksbergense]|uniref:Porin n=1 Tax=Mycolicibacterium frederiksbergense TaxID=117567 RepID=A0A6H0S4E8_9MYCO|nr:hypothetical protein [Mycolicibacterium frederiksbergense]QIV82114.1 hypothetical protein EXE63_15455 [Mycolicibacterium frederiksbergense]